MFYHRVKFDLEITNDLDAGVNYTILFSIGYSSLTYRDIDFMKYTSYSYFSTRNPDMSLVCHDVVLFTRYEDLETSLNYIVLRSIGGSSLTVRDSDLRQNTLYSYFSPRNATLVLVFG